MAALDHELITEVNKMLVRECKQVAFQFYGKNTPEWGKPDREQDPYNSYTRADLKLEKIIMSRLSRLGKDYGIIAEESASKERLERRVAPVRPKSGRYWIVDPIDGTFAFRHNIPTWGISVGLIEESQNGIFTSVLGSVYMPCIDTIFYNDNNISYEANNASEKSVQVKIMEPPKIEDLRKNNIVTVGNDKSRIAEFLTDKLRDDMPGSYVAQVLGVAKGQYLGTIMRARIWDMAGCHAVAKDLGVKVYDAETREEVPEFRRSDFIMDDADRYKWKLKRTHIVCYDFAKDLLFSKLRSK